MVGASRGIFRNGVSILQSGVMMVQCMCGILINLRHPIQSSPDIRITFTHLAFSPDGKQLVTSSDDETASAHLWDIEVR